MALLIVFMKSKDKRGGQLEVGEVLRRNWLSIETSGQYNTYQLRILRAVKECRTQALGGHIDACTSCGHIRISYNSCRNRHCPKCQGSKREQWIEKREQELLPVPYFHIVFTLPSVMNGHAMSNPKEVYNTLFESAWQTISTFGRDPKHLGAKCGMICILHTWGQSMTLHPHLHCIVPGGGLTESGNWKQARSKGKYLFPVKAMSAVFRGKYMSLIKMRIPDFGEAAIAEAYKKQWVLYAKRPFAHPRSVVEYLGRYTHKIAISNNRIKSVDQTQVTFEYKSYKNGGRKSQMTLSQMEFIRRFSLHILPKRFVRIRHYGILSSTSKMSSIPIIRQQVKEEEAQSFEPRKLKKHDPNVCSYCKTPTMIQIDVFSSRGPPEYLMDQPVKSSIH